MKDTDEILEQRVVKIIKKVTPKPTTTSSPQAQSKKKETKKVKKVNVRRRGALSVLGSKSRSPVLGGIDLGKQQVTKGPGLGGKAGSGGVQTSFYGKGQVASALGAGHNVKGMGGYGTSGAGGGAAGAGKQALVGSSGVSDIALGEEGLDEGGLSKDDIAAVIERNKGQLRFCYEQALQMDPKLAGRVRLAFVIGATGRVISSKVDFSSLNSESAHECMLLRLKSWQFPAPAGGVDVKVAPSFVFKRLGSSQ